MITIRLPPTTNIKLSMKFRGPTQNWQELGSQFSCRKENATWVSEYSKYGDEHGGEPEKFTLENFPITQLALIKTVEFCK